MKLTLPEPTLERFQPLRSGLLNLYKYENQEFWFERGRLLLRGNNGSGKSRVLALQLPFLFDGEISPHRVEPDGDPAKALAWNLLMNQHDDRVGYTWIEFGRRLKDGVTIFVTLGCGMRAVKGVSGLHNRWYFVTEKRVGRDFQLVTAHNQPLSRDQLAGMIGESALYRVAHEYRREVDNRLFGLNSRYDSLVELLIRLRAPQLARKLDEERLSGALSDALPPLSDTLIGDVAESFSNLDSLRSDLEEHKQMYSEVSDFLEDYRHYLQVAVRRRTDTLRSLHSRYEETNRKILDQTREAERTAQKISAAEKDKNTAELEETAASAQIDALRDSPFQRDAAALENAQKQAVSCKEHLAQVAEDAQNRGGQVKEAEDNFGKQQDRHKELSQELNGLLAEMSRGAEQAAFLVEHNRYVSVITAPKQRVGWLSETKEALERHAKRHTEAISHLIDLQNICLSKKKSLQEAQEKETDAEQQVTIQRETEREIDGHLRSLAEHVLSEYTKWSASLVWMHAAETNVLAETLARWLETGLASDRALPVILENAAKQAEGDRRSELARVEKRLEEIDKKIAALKSERNDLETGRHIPPPLPATRDPEARHQLDGAPLWEVCDFHNHLDEVTRASLEAALESSGLLDALVTPRGTLEIPGVCDTFLVHSEHSTDPAMHNLTIWLQPSLSADNPRARTLTPEAIDRALQCVGAGVGEGDNWVNTDGEWQLGPLRGRGTKLAAQHLGQGAREAARSRRLAEIENELAALSSERNPIENWREDLQTTRVRAINGERERAPIDDEIAAALGRRSDTRKRLAEARRNYEATQIVKATAQQEYQSSLSTRERESTDLGLSQWQQTPELLREHWHNYRMLSERLWPTARDWDNAHEQADRASAHLKRSQDDALTATKRLNEAQAKAVEADARYETLYSNTGASVAKLHEETRVAKANLEKAREKIEAATDAWAQAKSEQGAIQQQLQQLNADLATTVHDRAIAIDRLHLVAKHQLFADVHETFTEFEVEAWSVTRAVEIAREVERTLREVRADDDAWRNQQTILFQRFNDLQTALGAHGHQPQIEYPDDSLIAIACPFHGHPRRLGQLQAALADEIETQERLLTEKERAAIDNHLIGEIATTLQGLIRDAEARVAAMNDEITRCSTSTGLTMRLKWEERTEGTPDGLAEARQLLLADSELWSPDERRQLGEFLHGLIKEARAANPLGVWNDHLRQALDYRAWHNFAIERRQNGKWERLTKRRYGTGSGGEKALMLTVPQMAAAAAHYRSGSPHAPRLILLDEVFVGIDSKVRAKCMGLLEAFDLDFVMTSEREWGAYSTISGLAIYQLTTRPGIDAIATTRWVWNGRQKIRDLPFELDSRWGANGREQHVSEP